MVAPIPDWDGYIREVDRSFMRTLRRKLTAVGLFTPHVVRDMGVQTVTWFKYPEDDQPTTISMSIPGFSARSGKAPTTEKVDVPVLTRDAYWNKRQRLAAEVSGIDTLEAENHAFGMARDINDYLYKGFDTIPGLLNHPDVQDVTASTGGNWTNGQEQLTDINVALTALGQAEHDGPVVMLLNPDNGDLENVFVGTANDRQVRDRYPRRVSNIIYDRTIETNRFYLVEVSPENFDAVVPSEVGTIGRILRVTDSDPILDDLKIRWMTSVVPRIKRGEAVVMGAVART